MEQKALPLINQGMNRDLSISKAGESNAYENHNIRILNTDHDTSISVTNERGNKEIQLGSDIEGTLIGWNVLNEHIILFTTTTPDDKTAAENGADKIYRVDYKDDRTFELDNLYSGNLGFDIEHPIESVVYYETEKIQKIYWVDGKNVLRFMNFMADADERSAWSDGTYFDSNRAVEFGVTVEISKDNSGNPRANGVVQYLLTYFNKHGQESGYVWISDLVYLSPMNSGGSADSLNNNKVTLTFSGLDTRFSNFRIYSVFRSAYDGVTTGYIVGEDSTSGGTATIIDDGAHLTAIDSSSLLYLGSKNVIPGTLAHKDQTLFLGDLKSIGKKDYDDIEAALATMRDENGYCDSIVFSRVDGIDYPEDSGEYSYENQLKYTSSQITTFKGWEKYRFAVVFETANGDRSDAFWIGDAINKLYPRIVDGKIQKVIATCTFNRTVLNVIANTDFVTAQLMIAEASYADRSVKAQGVINPTVFNVWNRYNDRLYASPSWISRPRHSGFAWKHFEPVHNSTSSSGEIECNYWEFDGEPTPYFRLQYSGNGDYSYVGEQFVTAEEYDYIMVVYTISYEKFWGFNCYVTIAQAKLKDSSEDAVDALTGYVFDISETIDKGIYEYTIEDPQHGYFVIEMSRINNVSGKRQTCWRQIKEAMTELGLDEYMIDADTFERSWCEVCEENKNKSLHFNKKFDDPDDTLADMLNHGSSSADRWESLGDEVSENDTTRYTPALYNKNFMYIDENTVTLNSPEIEYEAVSFDNSSNYKLRIIGAIKITDCTTDYTVDASHGRLSGYNLNTVSFEGSLDGLTAWPLWRENGLITRASDDGGNKWILPSSITDYDSDDYWWSSSVVNYWLYLWSKSGKINGYTDANESEYSNLRSKTFANRRFAYSTYYNDSENDQVFYDIGEGALRLFNYTDSQTMSLSVGNDVRYYDGIVKESLSMPKKRKYRILYSRKSDYDSRNISTHLMYMYSATPVLIEHSSAPHAVINLGATRSDGKYIETILPKMFANEEITIDGHSTSSGTTTTGALLPWDKEYPDAYNYADGSFLPTGDQIYQYVFTMTSAYDSSTNTCSFEYIASSSAYNLGFVKYTWSQAIQYFTGKIYSVIRADDGYNYLVDVSNYSIGGDNDTVISLNDVEVIARAEDGVAGTEVTVISSFFSGTRSEPPYEGSNVMTLDVGTIELTDIDDYIYTDYDVDQADFSLTNGNIADNDRYLFIGEIFDPDWDNLYGGHTEAAIESNTFIPAGSQTVINRNWNGSLEADRGDTFFQRWDCLKTKPYSNSSVNNVIDITSFMVETHINIDGRTDLQRDINRLASIDYAQFGTLNRVYSQPDNFIASMDLDEDFNLDEYRSSVTWTLQKSDSADVDEWTHITLASSLSLDGDKGICRAIRRIANSLIAFQDRGVSEILFNSRTQLSTTDGVPVEIANSGKVDGKRYISNRFGCINKWSIIEGKQSLYFIDNINKAFCAFNGDGIQDLSTNLGFKTWFNRKNSTEVWNPTFNNVVSFFDKTHSDIYLVGRDEGDDMSCLVYSELLQRFSSFFDYSGVPMMTNVKDRFVSFKKHSLWLQNEGLYCNFFGDQYDFWVNYRVTPNPYTDKIWAGVDYRADFFRVLDENGTMEVAEQSLINGDLYDDNEGIYQEDTTFDKFKAWNEYQQTDENDITRHITSRYPDIRKKFRIWRLNMPRAMKSDTNKYGLDRIRNPWLQFRFKKILTGANEEQNKDLMQLHDVTIRYFE